jgi:hypothetical protein
MSKSVDCDLLCKNWAAFLLAAKSWWISSAARCALSRKMNTQKRRKKRVQSMVAKSRCTICLFPNRKSLFGICIFGGHGIENVGIHILWPFGKLYNAVHTFGMFYGHLVYFLVNWYILWSMGNFIPVLVCCTKYNLATLLQSFREIKNKCIFHCCRPAAHLTQLFARFFTYIYLILRCPGP